MPCWVAPRSALLVVPIEQRRRGFDVVQVVVDARKEHAALIRQHRHQRSAMR